ncbi:hypothetical protein [Pseudomonas sp. MUP55]|uniref:hypothetical protein n=1 Tax=Pseudomonas sp. MUP55 TaxID=3087234 RepID=UPI002A59BA62|nr:MULTISPECIES: hypothetical protein [unclassified Pseudomonas]WPN94730.1 hypothetical protein SC319_10260 [Pseudomonas sp. MUP56]WPO00257.1 hypothetical protein SC318_10260 [Pseudomonas sp. MUP55]
MNHSKRAWELAMVLVANGKIPFDPANPSGSVKILSRHLEALETALREEAMDLPVERLRNVGSRRPALACAD